MKDTDDTALVSLLYDGEVEHRKQRMYLLKIMISCNVHHKMLQNVLLCFY